MFSLVRFLRCTPFDEWTVWKQWVDKSPMGQQRMNTLVKSLLLRRTKDQKSSVTGEQIVPLPEKETIVHRMKLGPEENKVYQEVSFNLSNLICICYLVFSSFKSYLYVFIYFLALKQTILTTLTLRYFLNRDNICPKSKQKQDPG